MYLYRIIDTAFVEGIHIDCLQVLEQLISLSELDPVSARDEGVNMLAGGGEEFSVELIEILLMEVHEVSEVAGLKDPACCAWYLLKMELPEAALL